MANDNVRMVTELVRLHQALRATALPLESPGVEPLRASRAGMIDQLQDYVIPRVMTMDAPLLTVVGGSTGAGKSTLVNSLVGERVTVPGLLRPTTRSAVLVHHPDDAKWFGQDRLLPGLRRVSEPTNDQDAIQLVSSKKLTRGLAIIDAPDVDSVEAGNRTLAAELLGSADLWLFVTSSARYADQVPWESLKGAAERSAAVAIVLDRTPEDAIQTVSTHLARMLAARGLKDSPLFIVRDANVSEDGLLPKGHVGEIRTWLDALAEDAIARNLIATQTVDGAVRSISFNSYKLADAVEQQVRSAETLKAAVDEAYAAVGTALDDALDAGVLARGDAGTRWHDYVATGAFERASGEAVGRVRERAAAPQRDQQVRAGLALALELYVVRHTESAAESVGAAWAEIPEGKAILDLPGGEQLTRASRGVRPGAAHLIASWQGAVDDAVRAAAGERRETARPAAYALGGLGAAVMVGALGGPAEDSHAVVAGVVGLEQAASLIEHARDLLRQAVLELVGAEKHRYDAILAGLELDPAAPGAVRAAARRVDDARWASQSGKH